MRLIYEVHSWVTASALHQQTVALSQSLAGSAQDGVVLINFPGLQALGDRVSAVFVPAVCAVAFVTWLAWFLAGMATLFHAVAFLHMRLQ
jgi:hypothetical protein